MNHLTSLNAELSTKMNIDQFNYLHTSAQDLSSHIYSVDPVVQRLHSLATELQTHKVPQQKGETKDGINEEIKEQVKELKE